MQREDDRAEAVRKRLEAYDRLTVNFVVHAWDDAKSVRAVDLSIYLWQAPLVEYYSNAGILESFQGTESDVIYPEVKEHLNALKLESTF